MTMVAEVDKWLIDLSNWMTWKFQMKHLLLAKGLWGIIDGTEVLRENPTAQQEQSSKEVSKGILYPSVTVKH